MTSQGRQHNRQTKLQCTACLNRPKTCTWPQNMSVCTNPTIWPYILQNICTTHTLVLYILPINSVLAIFIWFSILIFWKTFSIYNANNLQGYLIFNLITLWHFWRYNDYAVLNNVHMMNWSGSARKQSTYLFISAWRFRGNYKMHLS